MFKRKTTYIEWDAYADMIATWDAIAFAQNTRQESVSRIPGLAETL